MTAREKIKSWRWRIKRVGHTDKSFAKASGVNRNQLSEYLTEKKLPSLPNFDLIESKLKELEGKMGVL